MKLIRYQNPSTRLTDWDNFFADPFGAFAPFFRPANHSSYGAGWRAVNWFEDQDHFYARIEMSGVKKEDLKLEVEEGLLRLSFEKVNKQAEGNSREVSRTDQTLRIPEGVQTAGIKAKMEDGILELSLPKAEEKKPVSIAIK